jgi:hypothetical protein
MARRPRSGKRAPGHSDAVAFHTHRKATDDQADGPVGSQGTSRVTAPMGGWQKTTNRNGNKKKDFRETQGNCRVGPNGDRETTLTDRTNDQPAGNKKVLPEKRARRHKVFLTMTLEWRPVKIRLFVVSTENEFILGLVILRAYNASTDPESQMLRLGEEGVPLSSPRAGPRPSSLVVANVHVLTVQCEGVCDGSTGEFLGVENGLADRAQRLKCKQDSTQAGP